jgi:hypothetical protein
MVSEDPWYVGACARGKCISCLTNGSSDHGAHLRWAKERVDDWDKSASLFVGATTRRSSSSLASKIAAICVVEIPAVS